MERLSGYEAATRILALHPASNVIYMSGRAGEMVMEKGVVSESVRILRKPVTKDVLLCAVQDVLGSRQTGG